jgi:histidinol-phosphate aminotransferase
MTTDPQMLSGGPRPRPGILDIAPYVGGRASAPGAAKVFKLSSNESPLGPSPHALAAYREAAERLHFYPEGSALALRTAIAEVHGLKPEQILCGNSSDELLHLIALTFCGPGDEVLMSRHGFLAYPIVARAAGAVPVSAAEIALTASVDNLLRAVTPRTKAVFLANPNNPTGSYLPAAEIRRLHAGLPPYVLLVLDAAYAEYVRLADYESGLELAQSAPNVVMTRTFSKIYALAGLRIGWMTGNPALLDAINRIRGPFNVSIPSQAAGAAAMRDRAHVETSYEHNQRWVPWLTERLRALGLTVHPSVCNFVLIAFPPEGPHTAAKADAYLMARGLILRGTGNYHLPDCLRLSVGTAEANGLVADALAAFLRTGA